jgi:hypothetical protein
MGRDARLRAQSANAAMDRCMLTLQRDGRVRVEGNATILEALILQHDRDQSPLDLRSAQDRAAEGAAADV